MKIELEFIHRSASSQLSPVRDVAWLGEDIFIVGYDCGLVELVQTDERAIISSYRFDEAVSGVCGKYIGETIVIYVLLKAARITCMRLDGNVWVTVWSNACNTAVSFAKPLLVRNGEVVVYVRSGQHKLAFANTTDGFVAREFDLNSVSGAKGMVIAMTAFRDSIAVLLESGHIVILNEDGEVKDTVQLVFPVDPLNDSIIPTGMAVLTEKTIVVGFSNGDVRSIEGDHKYLTAHGGVGCICDVPRRCKQVFGTWKGKLYLNQGGAVVEIPSPHACHVSQIVTNEAGNVLAVGSSDGRVSVWNL